MFRVLFYLGVSIIIAAGYVPTWSAPFDFIDDGNLVYAAADLTTSEHFRNYWDKVQANVEHLGPFRPVVWAHWYLMAEVSENDPVRWHLIRWFFCWASTLIMLVLFRTLGCSPAATALATAAAMWNPYRNEIWMSLTLAEGVAMPYAFLALWAATRALRSPHPLGWDILASGALLFCLGCKNVFIALIPAMLLLRNCSLPVSHTMKKSGRRSISLTGSLIILLPAALPIGHYFYFRSHWHQGQYELQGLSFAQLLRFLNWIKGAAGTDFLALAVILCAGLYYRSARKDKSCDPSFSALSDDLVVTPTSDATGSVAPGRDATRETTAEKAMVPQHSEANAPSHRLVLGVALTLFLCGMIVYLPLNMVAARYTMPAIWGIDLFFAWCLTRFFLRVENTRLKKLAVTVLLLSLAALLVALGARQEKLRARADLLWDLVHHVEENVPSGSIIAWVGTSQTSTTELNIEEGIHFHWHLLHRGKVSVGIKLYDLDGQPLQRVELPPIPHGPQYRLAGRSAETLDWIKAVHFERAYRGRRKYFRAVFESGNPTDLTRLPFDPVTLEFMKKQFLQPQADSQKLWKLVSQPDAKLPKSFETLTAEFPPN